MAIIFYPLAVSGGTGGVTSVAITTSTGILSITGSPITSSGDIVLGFATEPANTIFAGPTSGGSGTPTFRALVGADFGSISASDLSNGVTGSGAIVLGTAPTITGGALAGTFTGSPTFSGTPVFGNVPTFPAETAHFVFAGPVSGSAAPTFRALVAADIPSLPASIITSGQLSIANGGTGTATPGLVAGSNVTITGSWPDQTVNATISTAIATVVKTGSGSGDYSTNASSLTNVDGTNLIYTVTIPVGSKLLVWASGSAQPVAGSNGYVAVTDSVSGLVQAAEMSSPAAGALISSFDINGAITGDGASHTISLQYADSSTMIIRNATVGGVGTITPQMVFLLVEST